MMRTYRIVILGILCLVLLTIQTRVVAFQDDENTSSPCDLDLVILLDTSPSMAEHVRNNDKHKDIIGYLSTYLRAVNDRNGHGIQASLIAFADTSLLSDTSNSEEPNFNMIIKPQPISDWDIDDLEDIEFETDERVKTDFIEPLKQAKFLLAEHGSLNQPGCWPVVLLISDADLSSYTGTTDYSSLYSSDEKYAELIRPIVSEIKEEGVSLRLIAFEPDNEHIALWENTIGLVHDNVQVVENLSKPFPDGFHRTLFRGLLPPDILLSTRDSVDDPTYSYSVPNYSKEATLTFILDEGLEVETSDPAWELEERLEVDTIYQYRLIDNPKSESIFNIIGEGLYTPIPDFELADISIWPSAVSNNDGTIRIQAHLHNDSHHIFNAIRSQDEIDIIQDTRFELFAHIGGNSSYREKLVFNPRNGIYSLQLADEKIPDKLFFPVRIDVEYSSGIPDELDITSVTYEVYKNRLADIGIANPPVVIEPFAPVPGEPIIITVHVLGLPEIIDDSLTVTDNRGHSTELFPSTDSNDSFYYYYYDEGVAESDEYYILTEYTIRLPDGSVQTLDNTTTFTAQDPPAPEIILTHSVDDITEGKPIEFHATVKSLGVLEELEPSRLEIWQNDVRIKRLTIYPEHPDSLHGSDYTVPLQEHQLPPGDYQARVEYKLIQPRGSSATEYVYSDYAPFTVVPMTAPPSQWDKFSPYIAALLGIFVIGIGIVVVILYRKWQAQKPEELERRIKALRDERTTLEETIEEKEERIQTLETGEVVLKAELATEQGKLVEQSQAYTTLEVEKGQLQTDLDGERNKLTVAKPEIVELDKIKKAVEDSLKIPNYEKAIREMDAAFKTLSSVNENSAIRRSVEILSLILREIQEKKPENYEYIKQVAVLSTTSRSFTLHVLAQTLMQKWRDDPELALQEVYEILSKGGNIALLTAVANIDRSPIARMCEELANIADTSTLTTNDNLNEVIQLSSDFGQTGHALADVYRLMVSFMEAGLFLPQPDTNWHILQSKLPVLYDWVIEIEQKGMFKNEEEVEGIILSKLSTIREWVDVEIKNGKYIPELYWLSEQIIQWQIKTIQENREPSVEVSEIQQKANQLVELEPEQALLALYEALADGEDVGLLTAIATTNKQPIAPLANVLSEIVIGSDPAMPIKLAAVKTLVNDKFGNTGKALSLVYESMYLLAENSDEENSWTEYTFSWEQDDRLPLLLQQILTQIKETFNSIKANNFEEVQALLAKQSAYLSSQSQEIHLPELLWFLKFIDRRLITLPATKGPLVASIRPPLTSLIKENEPINKSRLNVLLDNFGGTVTIPTINVIGSGSVTFSNPKKYLYAGRHTIVSSSPFKETSSQLKLDIAHTDEIKRDTVFWMEKKWTVALDEKETQINPSNIAVDKTRNLLAKTYQNEESPGILIKIRGMKGSGKTQILNRLHEELIQSQVAIKTIKIDFAEYKGNGEQPDEWMWKKCLDSLEHPIDEQVSKREQFEEIVHRSSSDTGFMVLLLDHLDSFAKANLISVDLQFKLFSFVQHRKISLIITHDYPKADWEDSFYEKSVRRTMPFFNKEEEIIVSMLLCIQVQDILNKIKDTRFSNIAKLTIWYLSGGHPTFIEQLIASLPRNKNSLIGSQQIKKQTHELIHSNSEITKLWESGFSEDEKNILQVIVFDLIDKQTWRIKELFRTAVDASFVGIDYIGNGLQDRGIKLSEGKLRDGLTHLYKKGVIAKDFENVEQVASSYNLPVILKMGWLYYYIHAIKHDFVDSPATVDVAQSIVRISGHESQGTGFCISRGKKHFIVTCSHVIVSGLLKSENENLSQLSDKQYVEDSLINDQLVFAPYDMKSGKDKLDFESIVLFFYSPGEIDPKAIGYKWVGDDDISILEVKLTNGDYSNFLTHGKQPAIDKHQEYWTTYGYPVGYLEGKRVENIMIKGALSADDPHIEVNTTGEDVEMGFSGAPVWNEKNEIAGMVSQINNDTLVRLRPLKRIIELIDDPSQAKS